MSEETHHPELTPFEQTLAALQPLPGAFDRDRLMFEAGQASVPRRGWAWPSATAALLLLSAALGGALLLQASPRTAERIVYVPLLAVERQTVDSKNPPLSPADDRVMVRADTNDWPTQPGYLNVRREVLRWGTDVLPSPPSSPTVEPPLTLEEMLGKPRGTRSGSAEKPGDQS